MALKQIPLGDTGLLVSELVFGALPGGPIQKGMSPAELAPVIARCIRGGVTLIDGAHVYRTWPHVAEAFRLVGPEAAARVAVATKSASSDPVEFRGQLEECLAVLERPRADILFIHGARNDFSLDKYGRVIEELGRLKADGRIRHGALSTHRVAACRGALAVPEIEVVMPIANLAGMGIADGSLDEMLSAVAELRAAGRGLVLMKALAGGALIARREEALRWARERSGCHAVALGMVSEAEAGYNLALFGGEALPADGPGRGALAAKRLTILRKVCKRCGACVEKCPTGAMRVGPECAEPDPAKCVLCGYCIPACEHFCIRMV